MVDPFAVALAAFFLFGLGLAVAQDRFYRRLATATGAVSSTKEVYETFRRHPTAMPRASFVETRRRLRALVTRQQDPDAERLRRIALIFAVATIVAFLAIPCLSLIE